MTDQTAIEERIAHLTRAMDDLSDIVARHEREIATLSTRIRLLQEREAEREADALGPAPANQPPPHW